MAQQGEAHVGVAPHAVQPLVGVGGPLLDHVGAQVGEFARFEIAPHDFDGVEVVAECDYLSRHVPRKGPTRGQCRPNTSLETFCIVDICSMSPG